MCLCKRSKQYKEHPTVQFQILSLYHVNKQWVKQCSHHCQWPMVNDVDIAVESGFWGTKAGKDKLNNHKTITVSLLTPPKQTNGKISGNIYSIWNCPGSETRGFLLRGKTTGFRDTNREDNCSLCGEWTHRSAIALKDGRLHGQRLGGRKDIKAFSQSWQKNTGKWVDPAVLTKSGAGSARVPCFHAGLQCCDGWAAGKAQSTEAQLQLFKVDVNLWHFIIVIFC